VIISIQSCWTLSSI